MSPGRDGSPPGGQRKNRSRKATGKGGGARSGARRGGGRSGGQGGPRQPEDPMDALRDRLGKVLTRIPETQRKVLEYRMGLVDGHPHNLADTARELGLTMAEAKDIEKRGLEHIREAVPVDHLQRFLG